MGELSFTTVDIAIAAVILVSAVYAGMRGLLRETLSIFSWALSAYLTLRLLPSFRPMLREYVAPAWLADVTVIIGVFLICLIPLSYISHRISQTVRQTEIGPVDRALGLIFGVGRGLVVVGLAYIGFSVLVPPQNHPVWLTQARLFPIVDNTSDILLSLVPAAEDIGLNELGIFMPPGEDAPQTAETQQGEAESQSYGAEERGALDTLIESTGAP
jgi:membrane protein required for colicin V production